MSTTSEQPIGEPVAWRPAPWPEPGVHAGAHVTLRPISPEADARALYPVTHEPDGDPSVWTYLPDGPFADLGAFQAELEARAESRDPLFFTVTAPGDDTALGMLSLMSIVPEHGTIEIGHLMFAPALQRTTAATEANFLLAAYAFDDLGYRRLEWKCNALNQPSRDAALRFGYEFEGVFKQHRVFKGHNRDTAWFAITDKRWPAVRAAFETWLAPENFDQDGRQLRSLRELTKQDFAT
ncbi:MAG TPA: GNAT family protein [Solirubrobacteraceae bacterium]|nr:GNAT family protein [Solirubrobacteraceae bacterium]